jgi:acylphosphatase
MRMSGRRIRVVGRVQGVFFRNWTVDEAKSLRLTGWVRNRVDGSVEIEAHGEAAALEAFLAKVRRGPRSAEVERIEVEEIGGEAPADFTRASTA